MISLFLETLPPLLRQAGAIALEKRSNPGIRYKSDTGSEMSDIVTETDEAVQEFLLQALLKTDLRHCRMFAEEDTPSAKSFATNSEYMLSLDPIDGTLHYAKKGTDFWQIIIQLKTRCHFLVTFVYFPTHDQLMQIDASGIQMNGAPVNKAENQARCIFSFTEDAPSEAAAKLAQQHGLKFERVPEQVGSRIQDVARGAVRGLYAKNVNIYDGHVWCHMVEALGGTVMVPETGEVIGKNYDLFNVQGDRYPGVFLALLP